MPLKKNTVGSYCKRLLPALLFLIGHTTPSLAQDDVLNRLQTDYMRYSQTVLQEKIFAHIDKRFYATGEILWFKLYNVEAATHQPLDVSKVAYVELLDPTNKSVLQAKIDLHDGEGSGSLYLPVTLPSGNYRFRAYTAWMKNFGPDYFFEKTIPLFNPLKNEPPVAPAATPSYTVDFFPEGGNLVAGLQSKVAFQLTDPYGKGVDGHGIVVDENNDTVAHFQPLKFGIGTFVFTPVAHHRYKALITLANGNPVTKELPDIYASGYVMSVANTNDNKVSITVSQATNGTAVAAPIYLLAHNNKIVKAAEKAVTANGRAGFTIDKNSLNAGITQFTVFNASGQPVCERLYFIRPPMRLAIDASTDAAAYTTRKAVTINVLSKDTTGRPAAASLSMSVFKLDSLQGTTDMAITDYLWLTGDLKGTIESPDYYLSSNTAESEEATDNLMLTHGWRRFRREATTANEPSLFKYPPEYYGHIITGKVVDTRNGQPAKDVQVYLSVPGKQPKFYTAKSNDSGLLQFNVKDYYGAEELIVQTNNLTDSFYRVEVFNPYAEAYTSTPLPPFSLSPDQQATLQGYSIDMQVQNIYARDSVARFAVPALDSLPFYGRSDHAYNLDDYTRFTTMEEVLREYVREINVRRREGKLQLVIVDEPRRNLFQSNSLVLLDGVPVFNQEKLFAYDPLKVRKLEVIPKRFYSGYVSFDGIAAFTTYNGNLEGYPLDPRAIVLDYEGLQLQREFYSPVYQTEQQIKSRLPDFRNLLYWSPAIQTDASGQKQVRFYTSDQKGKYLVVLQGLNKQGQAASTSFTFEVK